MAEEQKQNGKKVVSLATVKANILANQHKLPSIYDFNNLESLLKTCEAIANSGFSPIKSKEGVMTAMLAGKELGLSPMASLTNIYPINDRPTLGINVILGICLQKGITYEIIEEFVPEYKYKLESGEVITEEELKKNRSSYFVFIEGASPAYLKTRKPEQMMAVRTPKPHDWVTTTEFTRHYIKPNGKEKEIKMKFSFRWSEAVERDYVTKDNWKKMPRHMLKVRCLTGNAKLIAPDYLTNISETSEMTDSYTDYSVVLNDDGDIAEIIEPITETVVETTEQIATDSNN